MSTYNRADVLPWALRSLMDQNMDSARCEVPAFMQEVLWSCLDFLTERPAESVSGGNRVVKSAH